MRTGTLFSRGETFENTNSVFGRAFRFRSGSADSVPFFHFNLFGRQLPRSDKKSDDEDRRRRCKKG